MVPAIDRNPQKFMEIPKVIAERSAEIRTRTGRVRRLDLADLENTDDVGSALEEAQARLAAIGAGEQRPSATSPVP